MKEKLKGMEEIYTKLGVAQGNSKEKKVYELTQKQYELNNEVNKLYNKIRGLKDKKLAIQDKIAQIERIKKQVYIDGGFKEVKFVKKK